MGFAHGQMQERELEDVMVRFINGELDVLVTTTIIETGLDISNVNTMIIHDRVRNIGSRTEPMLILYHMNMGYPLLSENSVVRINSGEVIPRTKHAAEGINSWDKMLPPTAGFEEQCYYHMFGQQRACAKIFSPDAGVGLAIRFDPTQLPYLTEWKMMGEKDYVLGLEPMNATLDGRKGLRESGQLPYIEAGQERVFEVCVEFFNSREAFDRSE